MKKWIVGLFIGLAVSVLGFIPIIIQGLPWHHAARPLSYWGSMGVIIVVAQVDVRPWLKGLIFAELMALPVAVLLYPRPLAYTMLASSAVFGPLMAILGDKFSQ